LEENEMHKLISTNWKFKAGLYTLTVVLLLAAAIVPALGAEPVFPEEHKELLSGGAYASMFGLDASALKPGPSSPTGIGRPPRVGPNTQANAPQQSFPDGLLGRSETTIAASGDGQHLVAGWNDADGFCGPPFNVACTTPAVPGLSGYSYSSDGGLTWADGGAPPVFDGIVTRGDPWLDSGGANANTFYYANLAVDETTGDSLGVSVHRGRFTGDGFAWYDVQAFDSPRNATNPGSDFYDKEALVASEDGSKAVYVTLTNFQETCNIPQWGWGTIEVWRSHDGGETWQGPAIASPDQSFVTDPNDPTCGDEGILQQSSVPAIGPGGEVYVVWQFGPTFFAGGVSPDADIVVARSLDGGVTFDAPVKVADINSMRQNPPVAYNRSRINDHPRIDVATSGPNRGRVFVTFYSAVSAVGPAANPTVQSLVSSQVFVSYSDDQGMTWSTPVPVAPAVPDTGIKRFWPVVSVEPGGNVDVIYYESMETQATPDPADIECNISIGGGLFRTGTASSLVDTYWAQSTDGGATFSAPVKVSTATTNWCMVASNIRPNMGDYIGSASGGDRVFPTWADGRNGVPDTFFANILGAGKSR
jgi:hypothetical protein